MRGTGFRRATLGQAAGGGKPSTRSTVPLFRGTVAGTLSGHALANRLISWSYLGQRDPLVGQHFGLSFPGAAAEPATGAPPIEPTERRESTRRHYTETTPDPGQFSLSFCFCWRSLGNSNPCFRRERATSGVNHQDRAPWTVFCATSCRCQRVKSPPASSRRLPPRENWCRWTRGRPPRRRGGCSNAVRQRRASRRRLAGCRRGSSGAIGQGRSGHAVGAARIIRSGKLPLLVLLVERRAAASRR